MKKMGVVFSVVLFSQVALFGFGKQVKKEIVPSQVINDVVVESSISGTGASFPYPYYKSVFDAYQSDTGITVNYVPSSSGEGLKAIQEKRVHFAGSDVVDPTVVPSNNYVFIPSALGTISFVFNLPGVDLLKLDRQVLSDIFSGKISMWNHADIQALNPGVQLPDLAISPAKRPSVSGISALISNYLSLEELNYSHIKVVDAYTDVVAFVEETEGSLSYIPTIYSGAHTLSPVALKTESGNYVLPNVEFIDVSPDAKSLEFNNFEVVNEARYPLVVMSYLVVPKELSLVTKNLKQSKQLVNFLWWLTHEGQLYSSELGAIPLPITFVKESGDAIKQMTYNGIVVF